MAAGADTRTGVVVIIVIVAAGTSLGGTTGGYVFYMIVGIFGTIIIIIANGCNGTLVCAATEKDCTQKK